MGSIAAVTAAAVLGLITQVPEVGAQEPSTREEYKTTAKVQELLSEELVAIPGREATIQALELAPGWVGEWHYHTGDVFVYVQEGEFVVDLEGKGRKVVRKGEVYHEAVNTVMQARNAAARQATKLLLFQVGTKGEPLMLRAVQK